MQSFPPNLTLTNTNKFSSNAPFGPLIKAVQEQDNIQPRAESSLHQDVYDLRMRKYDHECSSFCFVCSIHNIAIQAKQLILQPSLEWLPDTDTEAAAALTTKIT